MEINLTEIQNIRVEDLGEENLSQGNLPKNLSPVLCEKFLEIFNSLQEERDWFYPQFNFSIELKNNKTISILTEHRRVKINEKFYSLPEYLIDEEYPFIKIAGYHAKINTRFRLLEMKRNNPTKKWLDHFVSINDGYIFTVEGVMKADEAFNQFIGKLFFETDKGLTKEKAYSFMKDLYDVFNQLQNDRLIDIATEDREDICGYADQVLFSLGLYDENLNSQSDYWRDW